MRFGSILLAVLLAACAPAADDPSDTGAGEDSLTGSQKAASTLVTTADVNLRNGPSTSNAVVEVLPEGTEVTLLDSDPSNGFYHVKHGDRSGYCSGKYLKVAATTGAAPGEGGSGGEASGAGPSAAEILAALGGDCDEITSGRLAYDDGGTPKVPVCRATGAVYWTADLDVDCDGLASSACSKKTDPDYQAQTAATDSKGQPLDAASRPYVVVPLVSSRFSYKDAGLALGSVVAVIYKGQVSYGIIGDLGPSSAIGEASYAMAKSLGMDPSPTHGGADGGVTYVAFTGASARVARKESHDEAVSLGRSKASALVGH